jgi:uncharacterized transporter YbjL
VGLLILGVIAGIGLLATPGLDEALHSTGGQLLVVCLPVLSVAIGAYVFFVEAFAAGLDISGGGFD